MSYIQVPIDMNDVGTEDMIEELESRGYTVIEPDGENENVDTINIIEDDIYNLYRDYVQWIGNKASCSSFESALKCFFEKHTDKIVA